MEIRHKSSRAVLRRLDAATLEKVDLREARLEEADLSRQSLSQADLSGAHLSGATLRRANLRRANLQRARLRQADLSQADLSGADLRDAVLWDANLEYASLSGADLTGAQLACEIEPGKRLNPARLTGVIYDAFTRWPRGFVPDAYARTETRERHRARLRGMRLAAIVVGSLIAAANAYCFGLAIALAIQHHVQQGIATFGISGVLLILMVVWAWVYLHVRF
jgi:uncharacterized protein YjbI with pentapeptide repeats